MPCCVSLRSYRVCVLWLLWFCLWILPLRRSRHLSVFPFPLSRAHQVPSAAFLFISFSALRVRNALIKLASVFCFCLFVFLLWIGWCVFGISRYYCFFLIRSFLFDEKEMFLLPVRSCILLREYWTFCPSMLIDLCIVEAVSLLWKICIDVSCCFSIRYRLRFGSEGFLLSLNCFWLQWTSCLSLALLMSSFRSLFFGFWRNIVASEACKKWVKFDHGNG